MKLSQKQLRILINEVQGGIQGVRDLENTVSQVMLDKVFETFELHDPDMIDEVHDAARDAAVQFVTSLRSIGVL